MMATERVKRLAREATVFSWTIEKEINDTNDPTANDRYHYLIVDGTDVGDWYIKKTGLDTSWEIYVEGDVVDSSWSWQIARKRLIAIYSKEAR